MYIQRSLTTEVSRRMFQGKAIIIYGPRQSGKTTFIKELTKDDAVLWLNGDNPDVRELLANVTSARWKALIGKNHIVVIDEAQRIPEIGLAMKQLTDEVPEVQLIASGSSSFELISRTAEPLTGRKYEYQLLPLSFEELCAEHGLLDEKRMLPHRLVYGSYPDIITHQGDEQTLLSMLAGSYLYKDILMLDGVKKPQLLDKLIRALALQLGSEVSSGELSKLVGADVKTVDKYIDLLEKSYVVFSLPAFSRNARAEIRKGRKIYFYDLGIRNAVLGNFVQAESRTDIGALWENYLILERLKLQCNQPFPPRRYFWRNADQREVDYLEETATDLNAWEIKWNKNAAAKLPAAFVKAYPEAHTGLITPANYEDFLLKS